ncbi:MAG: hypothetical protein WBO70_05525, partial [Erysipelotrichaceae bacterium]
MEKLSRVKKYEEKRTDINLDSEEKTIEKTNLVRLKRSSNENAPKIGKSFDELFAVDENGNQYVEKLIDEAKQYNIEKGNRLDADTSVNVLRKLRTKDENITVDDIKEVEDEVKKENIEYSINQLTQPKNEFQQVKLSRANARQSLVMQLNEDVDLKI